VFLIVLFSAGFPVKAQEKPATAIEKAASLVEQAIKAVTGARQAKPAAPDPAPAPIFNRGLMHERAVLVERSKEEIQTRLKRLQLQAVVQQDWIDLHTELSEEKQRRLATEFTTEVAALQASWKADQSQRALGGAFPICFTDSLGPATELERDVHQRMNRIALLSEEQSENLSRAIAEREELRRTAAVGYVLNLFDKELYFTPTQREAIREAVVDQVDLNASSFSMQPRGRPGIHNPYFNEASVLDVLVSGKQHEVLSDNQKQLAGDLTAPPTSQQHVMISTGDDEETLQENLREIVKFQRQRLTRMLAVRADFYQATHALTDQQVRRLRVAGKGAIKDVLTNWKTNTTATAKRYRDRNQFGGRNVQFGMSVPQVRQVTDNNFWKQTVESVISEDSEAMNVREATRRKAIARFIVAMLDRELWLESFQRERLLRSVLKSLPATDDAQANQDRFDEIALLCIPLFKLSKLDLTILSPTQRAVWKIMKQPLKVNSGYVRVQTKKHGTVSFRIPK